MSHKVTKNILLVLGWAKLGSKAVADFPAAVVVKAVADNLAHSQAAVAVGRKAVEDSLAHY